MLLVRPMIMSLLSYHRTADLLHDRRTEVARLTDRNETLTTRLQYYKTNQYLAERARTFGFVMPGETPYVIRE